MTEENSIKYLLDNISGTSENVIINFSNFQLVQNMLDNTFYIIYNLATKVSNFNQMLSMLNGTNIDNENIIITINNKFISFANSNNKLFFTDGHKPEIRYRNRNFNVNMTMVNDKYLYNVLYDGNKIAEVNYTKSDVLLNSVFFDNIYLENIKNVFEQYQKLRIYPDGVIVDINGNMNKSDVISFVFKNDIIDKSNNDYIVQVNHYLEGSYSKEMYLYLNFSNGKAHIVEVEQSENVDVINNNVSNQSEEFFNQSFLGKRLPSSYIPLPHKKR